LHANVWSEVLKKRSEEDNIKMGFGEIPQEDEEWVQVTQNMT
jgi:hypothetical protein